MNKTSAKLAIVSILAVLGLSACSNTHKSTNSENAGESIEAESTQPMVGAYTQPRDLTPEELTLFRDTMKDDSITPCSVATQVVSGINYRFFCKGPDGDVVVTIYKPLDDAPRVTDVSK